MAKKNVSFVATRYRNKPVKVNFYTKSGERVSFRATEKAPVKERVSFRVKSSKK